MGLILANSVLLGMKDYTKSSDATPMNRFIAASDPYFNFFVYWEFVLKVIALGFSGKNAYLSDTWNWLDFFVVLCTMANDLVPLILGSSSGGSGIKVMRTVRLLRPLKLLRTIPSIRILISTLLSSVQSLGGIMALAIFFFLIFAILGVTIWNGKIHYRCYLTERPVNGEWELHPEYDNLCQIKNDQCTEYMGAKTFCGSRFEVFNDDGTPYQFNNPDLWVDT